MNKATFTKPQIRLLDTLLRETPEPTPDQVTQMARDILLADQEDMEAAIKENLRKKRQSAAWAKEAAGRRTLEFLAPLPPGAKTEVVSSTKDVDYVVQPQRQPYTVRQRDLEAFAKEHGLKASELRRVGLGEVGSYKGWERCNYLAGSFSLGHEYRKPAKPAPVDQPALGMKTVQELFRYAKQAINWTSDSPSAD